MAQPLSFEFSSLHEAKALHRMLTRLKLDAPDEIFFGSPMIAAVQHRLLDLVIEADSADGRDAARQQWETWRQAEEHPDALEVVRRHLSGKAEMLASWSAEQRATYVRDILAPLKVSETLLHELTTAYEEGNRQGSPGPSVGRAGRPTVTDDNSGRPPTHRADGQSP